MSNVPQSRHMRQADEATVAHSANRESAPVEGELVVSNVRSKARSKATPKVAEKQYSQEYLLKQIADLQRQVGEQARAIECHVIYRLEQAARIVELERGMAESRRGSAQVEEAQPSGQYSQEYLLSQIDSHWKTQKALSSRIEELEKQANEQSGKYSQEYLALHKRTEAAERQLDQMSRWKDQARTERDQAIAERDQARQYSQEYQAQAEAQAARIAILEHDLAQAQAERESAAAIVDDLTSQYRALGEENTSLRAALAEQEEAQEEQQTPLPWRGGTVLEWQKTRAALAEHEEAGTTPHAADLRHYLDATLKRVAHLEGLRASDDQYTDRLQADERWDEHKSASPAFEPATKEVVKAVRKIVKDKGGIYTPIYRADVAKAVGLSEQAAGRHMNIAVASGLFAAYRTEEQATVPDARLGQRKIVKKVLNVAPTELLENPKDWQRGDGKEHGGARRYCKHCHAENTLRTIPHTVCLECGHEDIFIPDDAQAAMDRARSVEAHDAPAAVAEAARIVAQVQPVEIGSALQRECDDRAAIV